jgi:hypothetical protein
MAAGEKELESLVWKDVLLHRVLLVLGRFAHVTRTGQQARLRGERAVSPDAVDRPIAGGRDEPRAGVRRQAIAPPALGRGRKRLLGGFLGEVEVTEEADQGRQDAPPLVAEGPLEDR